MDISLNCKGDGSAPLYESLDCDAFLLKDPGDPWHHSDGCLGLWECRSGFDAQLGVGTYDITGPAIEMRGPSSLRGVRAGFGNPNGEYPPQSGSVLRFAQSGLRIGRESNMVVSRVDDRMSLPVVENLTLYRDPLSVVSEELGDGAAIWTDHPSDQLTINNVSISCCTYGLLNTTYIDAFRIRGLHTGRVTYPLYFATREECGKFTSSWYGTVSDCCFADGEGPVVISGGSHPWSFSNVLIVRQGRRPPQGAPACNLMWHVNFGRYQGGVIDSPGELFDLFDGKGTRQGGRIDADGMIVRGDGNFISTFFRNARGDGKANLRLQQGSCRNIIHSQFAGTLNNAVDLIIEENCEDNVIHVVPGMSILDFGKNTRYIGAEWAGRLERGG